MADLSPRVDVRVRDCVQAAGNTVDSTRPTPSSDVPTGLLCGACRRLLVDPTQATCGDRFCHDCFAMLVKDENDPVCPVCGEFINRKMSWPDVFAAKEISLLHVLCPNCGTGCSWTGQMKRLETHLLECRFLPEDCPNLGCSERIARALKLKHLAEECLYRLIECQHCHQELISKSFESHLGMCLKRPVSCPNSCMDEGEVIPRDQLAAHLKVCHNKQDECEIINCKFVAPVGNMADHMSSHLTSHTKLINDACTSLQKQVESVQAGSKRNLDEQRQIQQSCLDRVQGISQRACSLEEQVTELTAHHKLSQQKTVAACYHAVDNLQKEMKTNLESLEHHVRSLTEKCLKFEEIISMQSARIRQLEDSTAKNQQDSRMPQVVQQQFQAQDRVLGAHDVKLSEHGLRLDMMDCKNTDGVLLWKITDIRRRRRDAVSGKTPSIYSQPFYTSPNGYKMCARMYLNGDGMGHGTHLSLFFVVMRGEYDSLLHWPFQQKVTLILIDQEGRRHITDTFRPDPSSSSFERPQSEMNIASGCPLFLPLSTLDGGGYINDDTIFIKIVVDAADLCRPEQRYE